MYPPELENQVTTTNCKRRLSCVDDNSNQDPQARKKHRILPVVIPDVIRQITSEIPDQVLNIQKLEAFFTHAKKKSNLLEIVKAYTSDVEGFNRQLEEIKRKYYMSNNIDSNDDQFMKMLKGVLKRLENLSPAPKNMSMTQQIGSSKLPVVIPDGIQQIISEIPDQVLNIQKLEAFFTHAKKKSKLLEIVKMYTSDVEGFKRQLEEIKRKYYMSNNVDSNDDQFMKMLKGVLERLENLSPTPKNVSMTQQIGSEQSF